MNIDKDIKLELLKSEIADIVISKIGKLDIDADKIADTVAISMLQEILSVIKDDTLSDFDMVDRIVTVFENKNISTGNCHDF